MSDDKTPTTPSWWQTLPGILTGLAAIITAVTGLILAFNRTGNRSEPAQPSSAISSGTPAASTAAPRSSGAPGSAAATTAIPLPALHQVKLGGGTTVVTILSAQVEPIDLDRRSLKFVVRHLNAGRYPANFWGSSYRLLVEDVPRAPTNSLNEVVDAGSAKEGDVIFELPAGVKDVVLQISAGEDKSRIPFTLP